MLKNYLLFFFWLLVKCIIKLIQGCIFFRITAALGVWGDVWRSGGKMKNWAWKVVSSFFILFTNKISLFPPKPAIFKGCHLNFNKIRLLILESMIWIFKVNELFHPGRMAYVMELEEETESDIPTTTIRNTQPSSSLI